MPWSSCHVQRSRIISVGHQSKTGVYYSFLAMIRSTARRELPRDGHVGHRDPGAREHNLRDVSLTLPRGRLICLTGVSGSGKSSLAFDTLYAEGQRRYVESLSSYARQFLGQMPKPEVDRIDGLSPSISIQQKTGGRNPRSTVGTITEINDYLRVLFARVGQGHCPRCDRPVAAQTREQIVARILDLPAGTSFSVLAPVIRGQKGEYKDLFADLARAGYVRARVNGQVYSLSENLSLDRQIKHHIEVVIDRLKVGARAPATRLAEAVEQALKLGEGTVIVAVEGQPDLLLSSHYACTFCGLSFDPPSPQLFSFNSPQGMCLACDGLGVRHDFDPDLLVPDPGSLGLGRRLAPLGPVKDVGKWRRHLFEGVAANFEADKDGPARGTMLKGPWRELDERFRNVWLYGAGDRHDRAPLEEPAGDLVARREVGGGGHRAPGPLSQVGRRPHPGPARAFHAQHGLPRVPGCPAQPPRPGRACRGQDARRVGCHAHRPSRQILRRPGRDDQPRKTNGKPTDHIPLDPVSRTIADELLKEIRGRLRFLTDVGLHYLALDRAAPSLSGGEAQRIRLASQVGAGLVGVLYILDEPSIGLHPRDNDRLIATLQRLRDVGNTVIVVEHDEDTMRAADWLVDFGPGPGIKGGEIVAQGTLAELARSKPSLTGAYLAGRAAIAVPSVRKTPDGRFLTVRAPAITTSRTSTSRSRWGCSSA